MFIKCSYQKMGDRDRVNCKGQRGLPALTSLEMQSFGKMMIIYLPHSFIHSPPA